MLFRIFILIFGISCIQAEELLDQGDACNDSQWRCDDGFCIPAAGKCNGTAECADATDESFITCRKNRCPEGTFRCAYGACVNGSAPCNTQQECHDNSDEALTRCLPETDRIRCDMQPTAKGVTFTCYYPTDCENGQLLDSSDRCDGKVDCSDGSDETLARCAEVQCPEESFRCAYGGCAHKYAQCNGVVDCADGSDEGDQLCGRSPTTAFPIIDATTSRPQATASCVLPAYPGNGTYTVPGEPYAGPGTTLPAVYLNYTCSPPHKILGKNLIFCYKGIWSREFPTCKLFCKLDKHVSVEYRCLISGSHSLQGSRECHKEEPSGVSVRPICRSPNYYAPTILPFMHCVDGNWDSVAACVPECGRTTPVGTKLVAGGRQAHRDELPWHVAVYRQEPTGYLQICGGTILTHNVVLSAAHCFDLGGGRQDNVTKYTVVAGKLHIDWNHPEDVDAQKSKVLEVKVPARYQGVTANYQDDIAMMVLASPLQYSVHVRPVCLDFDHEFDSRQLQDGNLGKVAGWGLTSKSGGPSPILKVVELPYVPVERCLEESPLDFRGYITSDKICAGYRNGTAVCRGDSGGGLTFPEYERGVWRHYLRGVVSTAPRGDHACNVDAVTTFTHFITHHNFIKSHFNKFRNS